MSRFTRIAGRVRLVGLVAILAAARTSAANAGEVAVKRHDKGASVTIDGNLFADYLTEGAPKPVVWPIIGPGGQEMTRAYPMRRVQGERIDHPHHRSLWFTHGDVNGIDFWSEPGRGKMVHREFLKCEADGKSAVISTVNDWSAAGGTKVCEDVRTLTFRGDDQVRSIDFDIAIKATDGPVRFGDTKEGTMGIRVPTAIDVAQPQGKSGGHILTSRGDKDRDAWGKQAEWVDYYGTVDGEVVGVAMLNHPASFRFPTHWHVRDYGLFAANPFGLHDFLRSENKDEGTYTLPEGETLHLHYRILLHKGDAEAAGLIEAFEEYAKEKRP